jgi:acid phosphatase
LKALAAQGIKLTNYFAVTHPSEPNYIASTGGDYFGMQNDAFNQVPANVSTIFDLLDEKGISWGVYQEDLPFSGFEGFAWPDQKTGANNCGFA